jgi:hypothetical protein
MPTLPQVATGPFPASTITRQKDSGREVEVFDLADRLTILSPCYDFQLTEIYVRCYEQARDTLRARFRLPDGSVRILPLIAGRVTLPNDSHIDRARNVVTNVWMQEARPDVRTNFALSIDVDIEFEPAHVLRIWQHLIRGVPFVTGHYAMKCIVPTFVANVKKGSATDAHGLREMHDGGTGFMGHHRRVLDLLASHHPEVKPYRMAANTPTPGATFIAYYSSGVYGPPENEGALPYWLSEDWKLCRMWQELGGQVMGDTEIKLRHFGRQLFPPSMDDVVAATIAYMQGGHPAIPVEKLRAALAAYQPRALPAAA